MQEKSSQANGVIFPINDVIYGWRIWLRNP